MTVDSERAVSSAPPPGWVPVEHRWLGLDRRSIPAALVIVAFAFVTAYVLPWINDAVDFDDPIVAGDVIDVGSGITLVPPTGWQLESGLRVTDSPVGPGAKQVLLTNDGVTVTAAVVPTGKGPDAVLDDFENISGNVLGKLPKFTVSGARAGVTSASGLTGAVESFSAVDTEGLIGVYTFPEKDVALAVLVQGPADQLAPSVDDVRQMLLSVQRKAAS